jgi:hypothetical protein
MAAEYEFSGDQNQLIGGLAHKMRFVGLFAIILGVLNLLVALLVVAAVYRDRIPTDFRAKAKEYLEKAREKLPDDVRKQSETYSLDKLPPNDHLWGVAISAGITGLFYLLMGSWTRSAGGSFQKIVDTQGSDIRNLMAGMGSLYKMYSLLYTLLVILLLAGVLSLGLTLYQYYAK